MSSLILRNSNRPLSVLDQMDRILDSFFADTTYAASACRTPAVDVQETETAYLMSMEIPGLSEKDVEIKVDGQLLTVASRTESSKEESAKDGAKWLMKERRASSFARSFSLPKDVDTDAISASAENGILTITLPRQEKAKPRLIDIKRG